jgi:hypothetical protein
MKPLSEVQEGDLVVVDYGEGYPPKIVKVAYVVPGDYFQAHGNHKWDFNGKSMYAGFEEAFVRRANAEEIQALEAEREVLLAKVNLIEWGKLEISVLKEVLKLVPLPSRLPPA